MISSFLQSQLSGARNVFSFLSRCKCRNVQPAQYSQGICLNALVSFASVNENTNLEIGGQAHRRLGDREGECELPDMVENGDMTDFQIAVLYEGDGGSDLENGGVALLPDHGAVDNVVFEVRDVVV